MYEMRDIFDMKTMTVANVVVSARKIASRNGTIQPKDVPEVSTSNMYDTLEKYFLLGQKCHQPFSRLGFDPMGPY